MFTFNMLATTVTIFSNPISLKGLLHTKLCYLTPPYFSDIGREHGGIQAEMVLDEDLRVLHLDLQAAEGDCGPHWS